MNLMFIIPSLSGGGAERVTITLASELRKKHNVVIVTYHDVNAKYSIDEDLKVECLNISDGKNIIEKFRNSTRRIALLKNIKKKYQIDCSISMLFSPNFENVMSRSGEKVIVSIRNKCSVTLRGFKGFINSFTCKNADVVVALSKNVMKDQISNYSTPKSKIITIYNPCDILGIQEKCKESISNQKFSEIREQFDKVIITAGRLTEQKAQWHMIRAFKEVVNKYPSAALVILGEGSLQDYLQTLIYELNLENNVFLIGFHSNPYPYLYQSDVFAFTSLFEGFGNILLEAMACGLPIVSCDCDAGPRELLSPKTDTFAFAKNVEYAEYGVLTEVMDGKKYSAVEELTSQELKFSQAILRIISEPKVIDYYKEQSKKRIQSFSVDNIIEEWLEIIK